jgi:hypothetical protein
MKFYFLAKIKNIGFFWSWINFKIIKDAEANFPQPHFSNFPKKMSEFVIYQNHKGSKITSHTEYSPPINPFYRHCNNPVEWIGE